MGACHSRSPKKGKKEAEAPVPSPETKFSKPGFLYSDLRSTLRPFDLLLFAGEDEISAMIRFLQVRNISEQRFNLSKMGKTEEDLLKELKTMGIFSHVGIVVTSEILNHPNVEPGKIYVWESTMGGKFGQNVQNIQHEDFLGVQLRNFDTLFDIYDEPYTTSIAVCHLEKNPYDLAKNEAERERLRFVFTNLFNRLDGTRYNMNPVDLASSMFPLLRPLRRKNKSGQATSSISSSGTTSSISSSRWLFCSELLAVVYTELGLYPDSVIPDNVLPMDLIGFDTDAITEGGLPCIFRLPPTRMVSERHFDGVSFFELDKIVPGLLPIDEKKDFRVESELSKNAKAKVEGIRKSKVSKNQSRGEMEEVISVKGSAVLLPIPRSASVSPPSSPAPSEIIFTLEDSSKLAASGADFSSNPDSVITSSTE